MNRSNAVHDDEEDEVNAEDGWGWILPVVTLGLIVFQIADAAMTSIFDEEDE